MSCLGRMKFSVLELLLCCLLSVASLTVKESKYLSQVIVGPMIKPPLSPTLTPGFQGRSGQRGQSKLYSLYSKLQVILFDYCVNQSNISKFDQVSRKMHQHLQYQISFVISNMKFSQCITLFGNVVHVNISFSQIQ